MKSKADQPKAPESKPGSKPKAKDDFKSLPLSEVEKNESSNRQDSTDERATASSGARRQSST